MAAYNMVGSGGYGFGGGGFAGLGDVGQSIYTGLGNAMPMLTQFYNFQDTNALRQDALNSAKANMMANTMSDQYKYMQEGAAVGALNKQLYQQADYCSNGLCTNAMTGTIYKDPNYVAPQSTVANASSAAQSNYMPQTFPTAAATYQWQANNPASINGTIPIGNAPFGYGIGGVR